MISYVDPAPEPESIVNRNPIVIPVSEPESIFNPGSGNYNGLVLDRFRVKPGMTVKGGPGMTDTNETG